MGEFSSIYIQQFHTPATKIFHSCCPIAEDIAPLIFYFVYKGYQNGQRSEAPQLHLSQHYLSMHLLVNLSALHHASIRLF